MDLDDEDLALIYSVRKRHSYGRMLEVLLATMVAIYALGAGVLYRQWDALRAQLEALRLQIRAGHFFGMILCSLCAVMCRGTRPPRAEGGATPCF
jgi:putative effector of murein hydrolase